MAQFQCRRLLRLLSKRIHSHSNRPPCPSQFQRAITRSQLSLQRRFTTKVPPPATITDEELIGHAKIDYSTIYKDRTGVTSGLWRLRVNLIREEYDKDNPPVRKPLVSKAPWQSSIYILYDFVNNPGIINEYIRFDGGVRFGRILEDMDSLAGNVAEVHADNDDGYPLSFVTASVDRIDLQRRFPLNRPLVMKGYPIYVGKTSLNIQIEIFDKRDDDFVICTANFIMVARDGITGKSTEVNPLSLEDDLDQQNFIRGRFDAQLKKEERKKELTAIKPSSEESGIIHDFWLDTTVRKRINMNEKDKFVAISRTSFQNIIITMPQHLNRNKKIFGGYLMKIAYELARATAYKFIGGLEDIYDDNVDQTQIINQHPQFVSSDEISFKHPVSVGCIIRNEACVACTDSMNVLLEEKHTDFSDQRKAMMIVVKTFLQEPGKSEEILSNVFSFCYVVPDPKRPIRRVIPLTYEESMAYINGKRALDETTRIAIREGSSFAAYL